MSSLTFKCRGRTAQSRVSGARAEMSAAILHFTVQFRIANDCAPADRTLGDPGSGSADGPARQGPPMLAQFYRSVGHVTDMCSVSTIVFDAISSDSTAHFGCLYNTTIPTQYQLKMTMFIPIQRQS